MKQIIIQISILFLLIICLGTDTHNRLPPAQAALPDSYPDSIEIVGGEDVPDPNPYKWQVSLGLRGFPNEVNGSGHICGASVIAERWILTAAHCLTNSLIGEQDPDTLRVIVDRRVRSEENRGIEINVEDYIVHEAYEESIIHNDIALIRLVEPIPNYETYAVPLMRAEQETALASPGMVAINTGWGGLRSYFWGESGPPDGQSYPDVLQYVELPIIPQAECDQQIRDLDFSGIFSTNICASHPEGDRGACQGDSGGPVVVSDGGKGYVQVGIISYGLGCGVPNSPSVYTRVSSYIQWIEEASGLTLPALPIAPTPEPTLTPTRTPIITPTPTPTATPEPADPIGLLGDVNCDTIINSVDGLFILRHGLGLLEGADQCEEGSTAINLGACDVSGDALCNSVDALFILQCDIGFVNLFCE